MKKTLTTIATTALILTSACTKEKIIEKEKPVEKIMATDQSDAETMALAAEQLLGSWNFPIGIKILDQALAKDPNNQRALFYKYLTMPLVKSFKGYVSRMKPIANKVGKLNNLISFGNNIKKMYPAQLSAFLIDGPEDIKTAADYQNYIIEAVNSFGDLRNFLKNNPDINLTLNINTDLVFNNLYSGNTRQTDIQDNCLYTQGPNGNWNVDCDFSKINQHILSPADALAIRQMAAGAYLYGILMTSYSVNGLETLANYYGAKLSQSQAQALVFKLPEFGKLRPDNHLAEIKNIGSDLLAAFKYVVENQSSLCPAPSNENPSWARSEKTRKGFVFEYGFCFTPGQTFESDLAKYEKALNGPVQLSFEAQNKTTIVTTVDPLAFVRNPVTDLRSIVPNAYNECDQPVSLTDKTLAGVFPQGDAELILRNNCNK